jgi:hypothetical protein
MLNQFFIEMANGQMILSDQNGEIVRFPFGGEDSPKQEISLSQYREQLNKSIRRISGPDGGCYYVESQQSFVFGFLAGLMAAGKPV